MVHAGKRTETLPHLAGESDALEKHWRSTCVHCYLKLYTLLHVRVCFFAPKRHPASAFSQTTGVQVYQRWVDEVEYFESQCLDKEVGILQVAALWMQSSTAVAVTETLPANRLNIRVIRGWNRSSAVVQTISYEFGHIVVQFAGADVTSFVVEVVGLLTSHAHYIIIYIYM